MNHEQTPPRIAEQKYRILSLGILLVLIIVGSFTVADYGMGWDEPTRWRSGDQKVDYYRQLVESEAPMDVIQAVGRDPYPGLFDISLSIAHQWTGWDRFLLGHWWSFGFGLVGICALWLCARMLGGARLAFWAALFLILTPPFYGHLFHNPKDIPFAAMYMVALWALTAFVSRLPAVQWWSVLPLGVVIGLVMSVRIAGLVVLGYYVCLIGLYLMRLWAEREDSPALLGLKKTIESHWKQLIQLALIGLAAAGIGFLVLLIWWPAGHRNIFAASGSTFQALHTSASEIPLFFRGLFYQAGDTPFYYAAWMTVIKSPESLLLLLAAAAAGLVSRIRGGIRSFLSEFSLPWSVIVLGALFPLLYITWTAPALHNGVRHFLFIFPPLCLLAAGGWLWILDRFPRDGSNRIGLIVRLLIPGLLFLQGVQLVALHPYQYTYYNSLIGGPAGSYGRYETEYWFTSTKHGLEWLGSYLGAQENPEVKKVFITGPWQVAEPFLAESMELTGDFRAADFILVNTQMMLDQRIEGETLHVIERMGLPILYIRALK